MKQDIVGFSKDQGREETNPEIFRRVYGSAAKENPGNLLILRSWVVLEEREGI